MKASDTTVATWQERVREWRQSGESAARFAEARGYAVSTLRYWSRKAATGDPTRFLRLVPRSADEPRGTEIVVEVGGARIRVGAGFDPAVLRSVVRTLASEGR